MEARQEDTITDVLKRKTGNCENCGGEFDKTRIFWRRFCSTKCRIAYHLKVKRLGERVIKERQAAADQTRADKQ